MISFFLDMAIVGAVVFCGWRGYKSGLIRGVFGIVSLILALFVSNIVAQAYADDAKTLLRPFASGIVESTMAELAGEGTQYGSDEHNPRIDDPSFARAYTALREIGLPIAAATTIAEQSMIAEIFDDGESSFSEVVAERLTSSLAYIGVFAVSFLLIAIVFAVIGNLIGVVFSLPGLKLVDTIAGAACGFVKGIIIVYVLAVVVRYFGLLMLPILEGTTVLYFIVNNNPIAAMLGV